MNIIQDIPLGRIELGDRLRAVDEDYAVLIAESIAERGQMTPVEVRSNGGDGWYTLVAGAHRMRAATLAGRDTVRAIVVDCDEMEAELREIDENLIRRELSELDRATFLYRRKELHEQLNPETKHGAVGNGRSRVDKIGDSTRFTAEVAEKLRLSERTIQRAVVRYTRLAPDVRQKIAGTWLADHGSQLDALVKCDSMEQRKVVALLFRDRDPVADVATAIRQVRGVQVAPVEHPDTLAMNRILAAWRKAGPVARKSAFDVIRKDMAKAKGQAADAEMVAA